MKNIIRKKFEILRKEWGKLKELSMEENISFEKSLELQERYLFYKNLLKAIEKLER